MNHPIRFRKKSAACFSIAFATCLVCSATAVFADWPQGAGPEGNFRVEADGPVSWSVAAEENISWKAKLPETGQSTPVIHSGRVFLSTLKPVEKDSEIGSDIVARCFDAKTGEQLWERDLPGQYPMRLSGCFGDSSSPPAVCDGRHVFFANSSGAIACFDMEGALIWQRTFLTVNRTLPFLHEGKVVLTRQIYPPDPSGVFPHKYSDAPKEQWTQLHAIDLATGKDAWTTECGINMGCAVLPQQLSDGRDVVVVGRGGGHGPPERPDGISLVDLKDGATIWTLPLERFMATMSYRVDRDQVYVFHDSEHLSIDANTGEIVRRVSITDDVSVRTHAADGWSNQTLSLDRGKNKRMITQTSNLLVGPWHYFRSYVRPWLGRVNVGCGRVEYLELPLQVEAESGSKQKRLWYAPPQTKKDPQLKAQSIVENQLKNSRGFTVFGDKRSKGNGWGHVASPTPSVAGDHLYVPVQNGTVYVIRWKASTLNEDAIAAINDLGPAGQAYTRASIAFDDGHAYAHTIGELIRIGEEETASPGVKE